MLKFLRTDRSLKDGLQNIPVISILVNQMINTLQHQNIVYSESLLRNIHITYKGVCKRGLQTFLAPGVEGVTVIPTRKASNTIYIRCFQIYKSAVSQSTVDLLERGSYVYVHLYTYVRT